MTVQLLRLGDEIDDYCPRCKLLLNHAVASIMGDTVVKVVCQTCHTEHPYKNAEVPPKKKSGPRAAPAEKAPETVAPVTSEPEAADDSPEPEDAAESPKKKTAAEPARYITRHAVRPPRGKR